MGSTFVETMLFRMSKRWTSSKEWRDSQLCHTVLFLGKLDCNHRESTKDSKAL